MKRNYLLRVSLKPLIPFLMIFGLYVQFHGDFGPGGGFQAGVIFAGAIILYTLIFGLEKAFSIFTARRLEILVASGVLLYGSVGLASMALGGNFLDYDLLIASPSEEHESSEHADTAHDSDHGGSDSHGVKEHDSEDHAATDHDSKGGHSEKSAEGSHDDGGHHAPPGQHLGILLVELGVGFTVTAVMIGLFFLFSARVALAGSGPEGDAAEETPA